MAATRDGIDALLRDRGLRRTTPDLTAESLLRGAHASAVLEGSDVVARRGARRAAAIRWRRPPYASARELLGLLPTLSTSPLQAFARMHTLAAKGVADDADLGRPRDADSAARLRDLGRHAVRAHDRARPWSSPRSCTPSSPTAAPFVSHNGLVARAAERLVLVARGVDAKSLIVPEAGHLALRREYESNLRGYRDGGAAGVHAWLLYAAEAYAEGRRGEPAQRRLTPPADMQAAPLPGVDGSRCRR